MEEQTPEQAWKAKDFERLQEELIKATEASKEKIQQWERFKTDYEALQARLYSLPDKLTHDVMVPFGKFAFMPGQLYHTNEILVLLGDNWFTKRSVKQALEIAERRKQNVIKMLEEEQKQFSDYKARQSFTANFQSIVEGHKDTVEIKEEYHPGEKERWKKRRARTSKEGKVPPPKQVFPRHNPSTGASTVETKSVSVSSGSHGSTTDEELWRRLDELEIEEGVMMDEDNSSEETTVDERRNVPPGQPIIAAQHSESFRGSDRGGPLRIAVKHTTQGHEKGTSVATEEATEETSKDKPMFRSPADIFQRSAASKKPSSSSNVTEEWSKPKAKATKGVKWDPKLVSFSDQNQEDKVEAEGETSSGDKTKMKRPPLMQTRAPMPFSGQVVERSSSSFPSQSHPAKVATAPSKVSKFKASRQKNK